MSFRKQVLIGFMLGAPLLVTNILVTPDNHKIAYDHYKAGHESVVIIAHGFFTSKDAALIKQMKDYLTDEYDVIVFDFRGHGKSSGLFTWTSKENLDLKTVLKYAKQEYKKIGIIGFSYGAAISICVVAEHNDVNSLVSISAPYDSMRIDYRFWKIDIKNDIFYNVGEGKKGRGVRPGPFWFGKKKPIHLVEKITCPVLYIHGDKDWVIGARHSKRLYAKTTSKKKIAIIKNGPHAEYLLREHSGEVSNLIKEWFRETIY